MFRSNCIGVLTIVTCLFGAQAFAQQTNEGQIETPSSANVATPIDPEKAAFAAWLQDLRDEALAKGISQETIDTALADVSLIKRVIKRDRNQPEVKQTYAKYLHARVSTWRKDKGRLMMKESADDLAAVALKYGVQAKYIAAIWGIETNYGTIPLTISAFDALATLAYDPRRAKRFRAELFAALEIVDKGYATYDLMKGSWAGAMGQPQFMPVSYLQFAQDFDGDGKKDIWTNRADVFASIAAYLQHYGWRDDQTWGRAVSLPKGGELSLIAKQEDGASPDRVCKRFKSMGAWRDLSDWQKLGVRRLNKDDLPTRTIDAALIIGDKGDDRGYLVYRNFCSTMLYNPAFKYALAVGMLADEISKGP